MELSAVDGDLKAWHPLAAIFVVGTTELVQALAVLNGGVEVAATAAAAAAAASVSAFVVSLLLRGTPL